MIIPRFISFLAGILFLLGMAVSDQVSAQTLDWSASGTGTPSGGTGNWNTTSALWALDGTSTYQTWPNTTDTAQFGGTGGTVTLTQNITASGITFNSDGYVLNQTGGSTLNLNAGSTITVANAGQTATINAPIAGSVSSLTVAGAGTLVLGGANNVPSLGFLSVVGGATIKLMSATSSFSSQPTLNFGSSSGTPTAGGSFILDNTGAAGTTSQTIGVNFGSGDNTVESNRVAAQNMSVVLNGWPQAEGNGGTLNLVVNGGTNGTQNLISVGSGTPTGFDYEGMFFNGSNYAYNAGGFIRGINYGVDSGSKTTAGTTSITGTYIQTTGAVTAQATATFSTLNLAGASTTAGANDFTIAATKTLTVNGILRSGNVAGSSSTISGGTLKGNSGLNNQIIIRTDTVNDSLKISSVISSGTFIAKSGAGTLTLSGANSYTGGTDVNAGTLLVNNATGSSGTGTGTVNVLQGATLGGHGFITGPTEIQSGAILNPSASNNGAGALTFKGGLQLDTGSTLTLNLGTAQDEIVVNGGTFSFNGLGELTLNLAGITGYNSTQAYTLINWTGSTASGISLADFALGSTPAGSAGVLSIVGNTLVLDGTAAVPEPSSLLLLVAGALGLGCFRVRSFFRA